MLPMTTLQLRDFATFETDLKGPNLLPEDATEPQIGFAELLGLTTGPLQQETLPAGLELPEGGKQLPPAGTSGGLQQAAVTMPQPLLPGRPSLTGPTANDPLARELVLGAEPRPTERVGIRHP